MSEVKEIKKRIDFLDYLKAICVIMVIITHYDWADKDSPFFTMLINMAVPVFMIISGYNFAMSNRKKTGGNLKKMYAWEMICCLGDDTSTALLKSMLSVGHRIPAKNILLSTGSAKQKVDLLDAAQMLVKHGYKLYATGGSSKFLTENGIENTRVLWPSEEAEGGAPKALEMLHNHEIDMVVNIPKNLTSSELSNGYKIRRAAIDLNVPLITNSRLASAFIYAFCTTKLEDIDIKAWGEYK